MTYDTTLDGAVDASQTEIYVDDLPTDAPAFITIGSETMSLDSVHGDFVTPPNPTKRIRLGVTRGALGSTPATHADEAAVSAYSAAGGSGGVTVDNTVDPPAQVQSIVAAGATIAGDEATLPFVIIDGATILQPPAGESANAPYVEFEADGGDGVGSFLTLGAGDGAPSHNAGDAILIGGVSTGATGGLPARVRASGGKASGVGGIARLQAGDGRIDSGANGGDVEIVGGAGDGAGRAGLIFLQSLPTADPHVVEALWNDAGTLKISAGP